MLNDQPYVSFVCAKTSCAPIRYHTIPRLELQAATMAVRLKDVIVKAHSIRVRKFVFWSDSTTTLQWIHGDITMYKKYVANRVAEILESSEATQWRWCPGELNPADDGTRAKFPPQYNPQGRWVMGHLFWSRKCLSGLKIICRHIFQVNALRSGKRKKTILFTVQVSFFDSFINRFYNYSRLKRAVA